jgi:hypothetical protein
MEDSFLVEYFKKRKIEIEIVTFFALLAGFFLQISQFRTVVATSSMRFCGRLYSFLGMAVL